MGYIVNGVVCDGLGHLKIKPIEIRQLYLSDVDLPFSHTTLRPLLKILKGSARLERLALVRCCVTDTLLEELLGALRTSPSRSRLRHLSLECNRLTTKSLMSLALFILRYRPPITRLNLGNCIYSLHSFLHDKFVSMLRTKTLLRPVRIEADESGLLFIQTQHKAPTHHGNVFTTPGVSYLLENLFKASYSHTNLFLEMLNFCGTRFVITLSLVQKFLRFNSIGYLGLDFCDLYGERLLFENRQTLNVFLSTRVFKCIDMEDGVLTADSQCMRNPDLYIHNLASSTIPSLATTPDKSTHNRRTSLGQAPELHFRAQINDSPDQERSHKLEALATVLSTNCAETNHRSSVQQSVDNSSWIQDAFRDTSQDSLNRNIQITNLLYKVAQDNYSGTDKGSDIILPEDSAHEEIEITDDDYQEVNTSPSPTAPMDPARIPVAKPQLSLSYEDESSYIAPDFVRKFLATSQDADHETKEKKSLLELAELSTSARGSDVSHLQESAHHALNSFSVNGGVIRRRQSQSPALSPAFAASGMDLDRRALSLPSRDCTPQRIPRQRSPNACILRFLDPPVVPPDNKEEFPCLNPLQVDVRRSFAGKSRSSIVRRLFL